MDTRTQIIHAAVWLFLKHGYNTVSVSDIANRAGVSKGGLYHHFSSKEALAEAVVDFYIRDFYLKVRSSMSNTNSTTREKLLAVFEFSAPDRGIWAVPAVEHAPEDRLNPSAVLRFLFEIARDNEELRQRVADSHDRVIDDLETMLCEGQDKGEVRQDLDCRHTALTIFSMHRGLLNLWAFNPEIEIDGSSQRMAEDMWRMIQAAELIQAVE